MIMHIVIAHITSVLR